MCVSPSDVGSGGEEEEEEEGLSGCRVHRTLLLCTVERKERRESFLSGRALSTFGRTLWYTASAYMYRIRSSRESPSEWVRERERGEE